MKGIRFHNWDCIPVISTYSSNGRTAIILIDKNDLENYGYQYAAHDPVCVATVNLADAELEKDEVLIKNWSENEGILEVLQEAGLIGPVIGKIQTGFTYAMKCKLLIDLKKAALDYAVMIATSKN